MSAPHPINTDNWNILHDRMYMKIIFDKLSQKMQTIMWRIFNVNIKRGFPNHPNHHICFTNHYYYLLCLRLVWFWKCDSYNHLVVLCVRGISRTTQLSNEWWFVWRIWILLRCSVASCALLSVLILLMYIRPSLNHSAGENPFAGSVTCHDEAQYLFTASKVPCMEPKYNITNSQRNVSMRSI